MSQRRKSSTGSVGGSPVRKTSSTKSKHDDCKSGTLAKKRIQSQVDSTTRLKSTPDKNSAAGKQPKKVQGNLPKRKMDRSAEGVSPPTLKTGGPKTQKQGQKNVTKPKRKQSVETVVKEDKADGAQGPQIKSEEPEKTSQLQVAEEKPKLGAEDKVSSDSIEVLEPDQSDDDNKKDSSDDSCSSGHMEEIYKNKFLILSDCEKLVASSAPESEADECQSPPSPPMPIDAVIHVKNNDMPPGGGARMKQPDPSFYPSSGGTSGDEDEITPVSHGYGLMHDLEQIAADGGVARPDSLSLPRPLQPKHKQLVRSESDSSSWSDIYSHHSSTEALIEAASATPLHNQGTVTKEGDMIAFVAEDLTEKIRMSSPLARKESDAGKSWRGSRTSSCHSVSSVNSMSSSNSGWSSSSASGWSALSNSGMSRSPSVLTQSPEDIPPIDPRALLELEMQAHRVAENLDHMMANLKTNLHKMSSVTGGCVEAYKEGVDSTCDSVDGAIKSMYALMAKCEELSRAFKPVYQLADKIKDIKRLLDLFESQVAKEEKS